MTRFAYEEYLKRYFKPDLLTAKELEQIVKIVGKNKKVQKLIEQDHQLISIVLKELHKENNNG